MMQTLAQNVVEGRQRNHGGYYLPDTVRHLEEMPLYRIVAWWGFFRGSEFTRDDVSRAFRIEPRRASGLLNYLCHRRETKDIVFEVHHQHGQHVNGLMVLRILSIEESRAPVAVPQPPRGSAPATGHQDRQVARWLLSRPSGLDHARMNAWKASCPIREEAC